MFVDMGKVYRFFKATGNLHGCCKATNPFFYFCMAFMRAVGFV